MKKPEVFSSGIWGLERIPGAVEKKIMGESVRESEKKVRIPDFSEKQLRDM